MELSIELEEALSSVDNKGLQKNLDSGAEPALPQLFAAVLPWVRTAPDHLQFSGMYPSMPQNSGELGPRRYTSVNPNTVGLLLSGCVCVYIYVHTNM